MIRRRIKKPSKTDIKWMEENGVMLPTTKIQRTMSVYDMEQKGKNHDFSGEGIILVNEQDDDLEKELVGKTFLEVIAKRHVWNGNKNLELTDSELIATGVMVYSFEGTGNLNNCIVNKVIKSGSNTSIENSYIQTLEGNSNELENSFVAKADICGFNAFENVRGLHIRARGEKFGNNVVDDDTHFKKYSVPIEMMPQCEKLKERYKTISAELESQK